MKLLGLLIVPAILAIFIIFLIIALIRNQKVFSMTKFLTQIIYVHNLLSIRGLRKRTLDYGFIDYDLAYSKFWIWPPIKALELPKDDDLVFNLDDLTEKDIMELIHFEKLSGLPLRVPGNVRGRMDFTMDNVRQLH